MSYYVLTELDYLTIKWYKTVSCAYMLKTIFFLFSIFG